jgi:hypothetical protein
MIFSEQYKSPEWQKTRLRIFERDNYMCVICGDAESQLHVHHSKYEKDNIFVDDEFLHTLCDYCHSYQSEVYKELSSILKQRIMFEPFILMIEIAIKTNDIIGTLKTLKNFDKGLICQEIE